MQTAVLLTDVNLTEDFWIVDSKAPKLCELLIHSHHYDHCLIFIHLYTNKTHTSNKISKMTIYYKMNTLGGSLFQSNINGKHNALRYYRMNINYKQFRIIKYKEQTNNKA